MDKHFCRGKESHTGDWIYGYYVSIPLGFNSDELVHVIFNPNEGEDYGWYEVDPDTVCRCVDVKDKNDTMIFENDIVGAEYKYDGRVIDGMVEFYDGSFYIRSMDSYGSPMIYLVENIKVTGNKFDNE